MRPFAGTVGWLFRDADPRCVAPFSQSSSDVVKGGGRSGGGGCSTDLIRVFALTFVYKHIKRASLFIKMGFDARSLNIMSKVMM